MNILIYSHGAGGHCMEYIHHIYHKVCNKTKHKFFILIPEDFSKKKIMLEWENCSNITIVCYSAKKYSPLSRALLVSKYIRKLKIDEVFAISLMHLMPYIIFFPTRAKIRGIIYSMYLYSWKSSSLTTKILNVIKYLIFSKFNLFKKVYLLNSKSSAHILNKLYKTNKFETLADPVFLSQYNGETYKREDMNIPSDIQVFLHFGEMEKRKGTLQILEAISKMTHTELNNKLFIFAGRIRSDITKDFYAILKTIPDKQKYILIYDKFCEYTFLYSLVAISDYVLAPYENVTMSSGCLAYCAIFNKMLIAPKSGLLGSLLKKYGMGKCINSVDHISIYKAITSCDKQPLTITQRHKKYLVDNSIAIFQSTICKDWLS